MGKLKRKRAWVYWSCDQCKQGGTVEYLRGYGSGVLALERAADTHKRYSAGRCARVDVKVSSLADGLMRIDFVG